MNLEPGDYPRAGASPRVSIDLATALVAHVGHDANLRVLAIKGLSLQAHRLRAPRISADVDVWVEPFLFDAFIAEIARAGWVERPRWRLSDAMTTHSISLLHPKWPCDIDVHREFPGFLAPAEQVFEVLWAHRVEMEFAGVACQVPSRPSSALILALHSFRSSSEDQRHLHEYQDLVSILKGEQDERFLNALSEVAAATGAAGSAAPFLNAVGAAVPAHDPSDNALIAWITHVNGGNDVTAVFLERWRETYWPRRVKVFWLAVWPSVEELRQALHSPELRGVGLVRARISRLSRAVKSLPRALHARRQARRGTWDTGYESSTE